MDTRLDCNVQDVDAVGCKDYDTVVIFKDAKQD